MYFRYFKQGENIKCLKRVISLYGEPRKDSFEGSTR